MKPIYNDIADQLLSLEMELRRLDLWRSEPPPPEALASTEPFCVDTLTLPEWLQFIFIPRMGQLIWAEQPLPHQCGIAPIAEEFFKETGGAGALVELLRAIDTRLQRG